MSICAVGLSNEALLQLIVSICQLDVCGHVVLTKSETPLYAFNFVIFCSLVNMDVL